MNKFKRKSVLIIGAIILVFFVALLIYPLAVAKNASSEFTYEDYEIEFEPENIPENYEESEATLWLMSEEELLEGEPLVSLLEETSSKVYINDLEIPVEVRRTPTELQKGLSGKVILDASAGMLFIFNTKSKHQFWMPDMNFPIDIIWIEGGQIADISHDVSNDFNSDDPTYYTPAVPVQYVLETNAGFALANNLNIGDEVRWNLVD